MDDGKYLPLPAEVVKVELDRLAALEAHGEDREH